jgi:hypothetical protein
MVQQLPRCREKTRQQFFAPQVVKRERVRFTSRSNDSDTIEFFDACEKVRRSNLQNAGNARD